MGSCVDQETFQDPSTDTNVLLRWAYEWNSDPWMSAMLEPKGLKMGAMSVVLTTADAMTDMTSIVPSQREIWRVLEGLDILKQGRKAAWAELGQYWQVGCYQIGC